jgi:hypothetical protein
MRIANGPAFKGPSVQDIFVVKTAKPNGAPYTLASPILIMWNCWMA